MTITKAWAIVSPDGKLHGIRLSQPVPMRGYTCEEVTITRGEQRDNGTTHYEGCFDAGPEHYACALEEARVQKQEAERYFELLNEAEHCPDMVSVPREPTEAMVEAAVHCLDGQNLSSYSRHERARVKARARYKAMLAAAPPASLAPEVEKDARRWQLFCELWAVSTEMRVTQDEDGTWSIFQVEDVDGDRFNKLNGDNPDAAIDAALAASQPK